MLRARTLQFTRNESPATPQLGHQSEQFNVLLKGPVSTLNARIAVIDPALATLLERTEESAPRLAEEDKRDGLPFLRSLVAGDVVEEL